MPTTGRIATTGVLLVITAALAMWSRGWGPAGDPVVVLEPHQTDNPQSRELAAESVEVEREEIGGPVLPSAPDPDATAGADGVLQTLRNCLRNEDGPPQFDKADCFVGLDYSLLSRSDVGSLLGDHGLSYYGRSLLLKGYLLQFNPGDALSELNELSAIAGSDDYRSYEVFAAAVRFIGEENPAWVETFAALLTGPDLFGPKGTRNELQIAGQLVEIRPGLKAILEAGARGEWGGSAGQVDQAFMVLMLDARLGDTGPFLELMDSVIDSAFLTKDNGWALAQSALGDLMFHGKEHPESRDDLALRVWRMLDDPDLSLAMAMQIHHQGLGFGGEELLGEEETLRLRLRAQSVLAARYGESYLKQ